MSPRDARGTAAGRRLVLMAHAMAPGPGGPEGHVNARLVEALAGHWPGPVTVISGGLDLPAVSGARVDHLPGWRHYGLGEGGEGEAPGGRALRWLSASRKGGGVAGVPGRVANRMCFWATGRGLKANGWIGAASRTLARELARDASLLVYSRALPWGSIAACARLKRAHGFPWAVNFNDPLPADVWPGLYASHPWTDRSTRWAVRAVAGRIDAVTFPSGQLRDIQVRAFPVLAPLPHRILPHLAPVRPGGDAKRAPGPLRIAFAGTLRQTRAREGFLQGLRRILDADPACGDDVTFDFHLARPNPHGQRFIESIPFTTEVTVGIFGEELDRRLARADVVLDLEAPEDGPLLLTKVANCVGLSKPIWAVSVPGGTAHSLVEEGGWGYHTPLDDPEAVAGTLRTMLRDVADGSLVRRRPSAEFARRFQPEEQVRELVEMFESLVEARGAT